MNFSDFESWFETHKYLLPDGVKKTYEKNMGHLEFIFTWKEYERILSPKLRALLYRQHPLLLHAAKDFEPHIHQTIEHTIFETMESMWRIVAKNRAGIKPAEALPKLYANILKWKKEHHAPQNLYDIKEEQKNSLYKWWSRSKRRRHIRQFNREIWQAFNWRKKYYEDFIDVMQPDLLQLLPELLNMDAEWWDVYVFHLRFQCDIWKDDNNRFSFLTEYGLGAEWINSGIGEIHNEIERREEEKKKE